MKKLFIFLLLCAPAQIYAAKGVISGSCEKGAGQITIAGMQSTDYVQKSFPACTVTVYNQGTSVLATIYSDSVGTSKVNPFTAGPDGYYSFFTNDGNFDVQLSGTGILTSFIRTYNVGGSLATLVSTIPVGNGIPQALGTGLLATGWYEFGPGTATFSYASPINDGACVSGSSTITVTGAAVGKGVQIGANPALPVGVIVYGRVTSANTVTVDVCNWTGIAITPGATIYTAQVIN